MSGQAENLIKLHKTQLASDRTSCRSALANQVRLVLHTAAYWLMLTVRDAAVDAVTDAEMLDVGSAEWIYDSLYCARGQAENLIKLHKTQLASDRTSCRSALANQVRLVLHTAAYWLMLTVRDAAVRRSPTRSVSCSIRPLIG
ncbi:saccharopine dehydrogenase-like NADP-dependent oxidoreductase [Bradyrhizobium japonicum]